MPFVYILQIGNENLFKIGKAVDVERRGKQLATGNPHPLTEFARIETEHPFACERYLKHRLRTKRSRRSEAREIYEVEPAEFEELIRDAANLVEEHEVALNEAERLSKEPHDDQMLLPTDDQRSTHRRLLEVREALGELTFERERLESDLKIAIGNAEGLEGIATWKTLVREDINRDELREKEPEVWARYRREIRTRRFDVL